MALNFSEKSVKICRDFLQTAVIIDDHFDSQPQTVPEKLTVAPGRKTASKPIIILKKTAIKRGALNVNDLINSFASNGIICGALNFKEYSKDSDLFLKTAKRADITIIDWEMEKEKSGENALNLISALLKNDLLSPQRLRLISIYTATVDLSIVSESIQKHLREKHSVQLVVQLNGLHLTYQSIILTIYAKNRHGIPKHFKEAVANEQELPNRLISCFSKSINGLLPNIALSALTALRNNSHKLLGQFSNRLDAAYLSHKIMSAPPEDAENQLVQLISSHISDILEANHISEQANYRAAELWLKEKTTSGFQFRKRIHSKKNNGHAEGQLLKLIEKGLNKANLNKKNKTFKNKISELKGNSNIAKTALSDLTAIFSQKPEDSETLDRDFSYMLSCKSYYDQSKPKLEPGTILKHIGEEGTERYMVCIQPACDCVRIPKKGINFLFLPLETKAEQFDICIPQKSSPTLKLKVNDKSFSIITRHFAPPKSWAPIYAILKDGEQWMFANQNESDSYQWIATLRQELVLRLAHNYGKNVTRVGITESEWQRRWAK